MCGDVVQLDVTGTDPDAAKTEAACARRTEPAFGRLGWSLYETGCST